MRILFPVALAFAATASAQPTAEPDQMLRGARLVTGSDCRGATSHLAGRGSAWRDGPLKPQRLTDLPPADAYAAVYQRDERGCIIPVMYPDARARRR